MSSTGEEGPSVLQDTQQFFTPQGKGAGSKTGTERPSGITIEQTAECEYQWVWSLYTNGRDLCMTVGVVLFADML